MNMPDSILEIAREESEKHAKDIARAVESAEARIKSLPEYKSFVLALVRDAVQHLVYQARHTMNTKIKKDLGEYAGTQKVEHGSRSVSEVYESVYNYRINGRILGDIEGDELPEIAKGQREIAKGHTTNALLCEHLAKLVPAGFKVRQKVSEAKLRQIFTRITKRGTEAKV